MSRHVIFVMVAAAILLGAFFLRPVEPKQATADLDDFARCLREKNITMYGADWCAHCQNQKKEFGESFRLVPYVECPEDPQKCLAAGIENYPTWIFPDGRKLQGEQRIETLSYESDCLIKNIKN